MAMPTFPVAMTDGDVSITVETAAGYWQAVWDGFVVDGDPLPPARDGVHATLADLDTFGLTHAPVRVLGPGVPVPSDTPAGCLIVRTAS